MEKQQPSEIPSEIYDFSSRNIRDDCAQARPCGPRSNEKCWCQKIVHATVICNVLHNERNDEMKN